MKNDPSESKFLIQLVNVLLQTKASRKPVSMQIVDTNFLCCLRRGETAQNIYVLKKCVFNKSKT